MNRNGGGTLANEQQFFSPNNQTVLIQTLTKEFQRTQGAQFDATQANRLARTLEHYMNEVWDTNGPMPLQTLNREALNATANDFQSYLRRSNIQFTTSPHQQALRTVPSALTTSVQNTQRPLLEDGVDPRIAMDTGSRYEQLQKERGGGATQRPAVPEFRINLEDDSVPAVDLFERIKKQREEEAVRGASSVVANQEANPIQRLVRPSIADDPNVNPTLALPSIPPAVAPAPKASGQDVLIKQDDVISYKEIENNLFVYSADRDWLNNVRDTRYSFTVNFQRGNNGQQTGYGPTSTEKFKNIVRVELVKAILPTEGLETFVTITNKTGPVYDTTARLNTLQYPFVTVRIPELDTNNYGTNDSLDRSFGVLQYDANWISDSSNAYMNSRGWLALIPKFLKCQKVYSPTPLATLNKLTIELDRPDGQILTSTPDTVNIAQIFAGALLPGTTTNTKFTTGADSSSSQYYYFYTGASNYFSQFTISAGDRVQLGGITSNLYSNSVGTAVTDMATYFQQPGGLPVVAIGYSNGGAWNDGPLSNTGYANFFVLRANFQDPTLGLTAIQPFGGTATTNGALASNLSNTAVTGSVRAINLSHQTQFVFRVITRELDPTSRVRPDNL